MRILLDLHVFLWAITDDPRLGVFTRDLISSKTCEPLTLLSSDRAFEPYGAMLQDARR
jgi:PIN domain nuclease of toxin-antitoxin system